MKTNRLRPPILLALGCVLSGAVGALAQTVFEGQSPYHFVRVVDQAGVRRLQFNDSWESQMSLADPTKGHFEYTEYFHMPWLWSTNIQRVLLLGLGGGSIQRALLNYYPNLKLDTAEMDPLVITVAEKYFGVKATPRHRILQSDGRVFLKRGTGLYDLIIADAYTTSRYGSSLPPHLTTKEFFTLANARLSTNGILAYNVIGQINGWRANILGSMYRTLDSVFPRVYLFPAKETMNVVLVATKSDVALTQAQAQTIGAERVRQRQVAFPNFALRLRQFQSEPPRNFADCAILTDDHAPIESLMRDAR